MATDIDSLQIEINAQSQKANTAIDNLVKKIDRLATSLSSIDGSKLSSLASGVSQLGTAMQTMNTVKTSDFTRLAKNLTALNNIDVSKLGDMSSNIAKIGQSLGSLNGIADGVKQITDLADGIKQLGYTSADKAITNIPRLATAVKQLMKELSTAPKVSQNLIDMTDALAKLARTGASSGRAAQSLSNSFTGIYKSSGFAAAGLKKVNARIVSLTRSIIPVVGVWQLFNFGKQAMEISSDLTEVQNVVDVTFGDFKQKIEDLADVSIPELGMSELTVKQIGSRFQSMGTAMGFAQGKMADMSVELTRLTGDMASFYNVSQEDMGKALQSIFTGETEPMRRYGIDLTNATIQQYALNQGITESVSKMTQLEKAQLRYNYVMAQTAAAQGDFIRTQDTWANQVRILKQNFQQLASIIGGTLINAFKPLVQALNSAMSHIIAFAQTVSNALGKIFGWKFEVGGGGVTNDLETGASAADDIASGIGDAVDNAKKLNRQLQAFDALNVLTSASNTGSSTGLGGTSSTGAGTGTAKGGNWVKADSIFKDFESDIGNFFELGEYIRDSLIGVMESIDWDSVYEKARGFGKGLADFLNGLFAYDGEGKTLFGEVGRTLANTLNTIIYAALEFGKEFDFYQFGVNIADGINNFFENFDFVALAETLNVWVDGIKDAISGFLDTITWESVLKGATDFLGALELDTLTVIVGSILWKYGLKDLTKSLLSELLVEKLGITPLTVTLGLTVAIGIVWVGSKIKEQIDEIFSDKSIYTVPEAWKTGTKNWNFWDYVKGTFDVLGLNIKRFFEGLKIDITLSIQDFINDKLDEFFSVFNWEGTKEIFADAKERFITAFNAPWLEGEGIFSEDIGKNILLGILEGFAGAFSFIAEPVVNFFQELWKNICDVFGIHSPADEMKPIGENILLGVVEGFEGAFESISVVIENLKSLFTRKFVEIKNSVLRVVSNLVSGIIERINSALSAFGLLEQKEIRSSALNVGKNIYSSVGSKLKINGYADGGFPQKYSLFMAGENGIPEIAGTVGGKPAVAGGAEITGISDTIRSTSREEIDLLKQQNALLQAILEKEYGISSSGLFQAVKQEYQSEARRQGASRVPVWG